MSSRVLTVMFTDIKGFTERTSQSSREELDQLLDEHEEILMPLLPDFGGRLVKTVGDALMITFESPTNAVLCGVMMQERMRERNKDMPEGERIEIRVAINSGEVLERDGDVFGDAVNIAARIEGITEVSEIFFTESVYLAMNKAEVPSSEVGMRRLKGVPEPIKIYRVIQDRHSERYTKLIKRLRTSVFKEVPVPSTGGMDEKKKGVGSLGIAVLAGAGISGLALVAFLVISLLNRDTTPALRPETGETRGVPKTPSGVPDPVLQAAGGVKQALGDGDLGLALARAEAMLKENPGRKESHEALRNVVEAEVRALVEMKKHEEALKLIETRRESQNYMKFSDLERDVRLELAAVWVERGRFTNGANEYGRLMKDHPEDLEILRAVVRDMSRSSHSAFLGIAESTARRIAELTEGTLEEPVARALIDSLKRHDRNRDRARENRRLLAERYPAATDALRKNLLSDHRITRMNAFHFLKEQDSLSPREELAVHVKNMTLLRATGGRDAEELKLSLDVLEMESARPDWEERKKGLDIGRITKIAAIRSRNKTTERLFLLLARAFFPEVKPSLPEWIEGRDLVVRHAAFRILKEGGLDREFDVWAYHAGNLVLENYSLTYTCLHEAIAFFKAQASTPRAAEARRLLQEGRKEMMNHLETREIYGHKGRRRLFDINLKAVDDALKAFE